MGLFGKSKQVQAEELGKEVGQLVNVTAQPLMQKKMLLKAVEADPFTAGYLQAKFMELIIMGSQGKNFGGGELNVAGLVALQQIFGADAMTAGIRIKEHNAARTPEFLRGRQRAVELLKYQLGQSRVSSDPKYASGVERAKAILQQMRALSGSGHMEPTEGDVALALEAIEFGDRVVAVS